MSDESDRVKRLQGASRKGKQKRARQDVEDIMGMIYREAATPGCSSRLMSSDTGILDRIDTVTFPGRYVTRVLRVRPFEVTKRFVRPQLACDHNSEPNADSVVSKLFGIQQLQNLLLVITPTSTTTEKHIVHGYAIDGERHLGVTSLTTDEKDLIVNTQRADNYSIIYSSDYLELEHAFKKTEIKNRIFEVFQQKPTRSVCLTYAGNNVTLRYRHCKPQKKEKITKDIKKKTRNELSAVNEANPKQHLKPVRHDCLSRPQPNTGHKNNSMKQKTLVGTSSRLPVGNCNRLSSTSIRARSQLQATKDNTSSTRRSPLENRSRASFSPDSSNEISRASLNTPQMASQNHNHRAKSRLRTRDHSQETIDKNNPNPKAHGKPQVSISPKPKMSTRTHTNSPATLEKKNSEHRSLIKNRTHPRVRSRSNSAVANDSTSSVQGELIRNRTHSIMRSRSDSPVANGSTSLVQSSQIRNRTHSVIISRSDSPVANVCSSENGRLAKKRKSSRHGDGDCNTRSNLAITAEGGNTESRYLIINRTHSGLRSRSNSPVSKPCCKHTDLYMSMGNRDVTGKVSIESRFRSPVNDSCSSEHKPLVTHRTYSALARNRSNESDNVKDKNALGKRTNSFLSNESSELNIKTLMKPRSNVPLTTDSSNSILRSPLGNRNDSNDAAKICSNSPVSNESQCSLNRTPVATRMNSNASIVSSELEYQTPRGTRSPSPVTSNSFVSMIRAPLPARTHSANLIGEPNSNSADTANGRNSISKVPTESQVSIDSNDIKPMFPNAFTHAGDSVFSNCDLRGDGMAQEISEKESSGSVETSYISCFYSNPYPTAGLNAVLPPEQDVFSSVMSIKDWDLPHGFNLQDVTERNINTNDLGHVQQRFKRGQAIANGKDMKSPELTASQAQPQPYSNNREPKASTKRKIFIPQLDKEMLYQRERLWNCCVGLNSKRRVNFKIESNKDAAQLTKKIVREEPPKVKSDGVKVLWKPHPLCESEGDIYIPSELSKLKFDCSQSIIRARSSYFERLMDPVRVPPNFSKRAYDQLQKKLSRMTAKQAFDNLARLVENINARAIPQNRQLLTFFRIAELLEIKMYVRTESYWTGRSPTIDPRCRCECYMFDDRSEFVLSVGLLSKQLNIFAELFPGIKPNIRYIDNAFELTQMPTMLTKCIRSVMVTLRAQTLFNMMAEVAYEVLSPKATLLALSQERPRKPKPIAKSKEEDTELQRILEIEEARRQLHRQQQHPVEGE